MADEKGGFEPRRNTEVCEGALETLVRHVRFVLEYALREDEDVDDIDCFEWQLKRRFKNEEARWEQTYAEGRTDLYHRIGEECLFPLRDCGQGTDLPEYSFLQEAIRNDGKINSIKLREAVISNG